MTPLDMLSALVVMIIWGLNFVAVKFAVADIPPLLLTSLRFFSVGLLLAPFFCLPRQYLNRILLLSLVMGVLHFGLIMIGIAEVDAAAAAIIIQLGVPFSSLLALLFFKDRLGLWRTSGLILAFAGVVLLAGEPHLRNPVWLLFIVGAALAWAVGNIISKKLKGLSPMRINGYMALFAAPQLLVLSLAFESEQREALQNASWNAFGGLAFMVLLSSLVAYTLWYRLLDRYDINQIVPFSMLGPVFGVIAGVTILDEPVTWHKVVGGMITLIGVGIIQMREIKKSQEPDIVETPS